VGAVSAELFGHLTHGEQAAGAEPADVAGLAAVA
jgi:hypothetical protein